MEGYSVLVATRAPESVGPLHEVEDLASDLMDVVQPHHGVISVGATSWDARISVDAENATAASDQALAIVEEARRKVGLPDWPVVEVQVIREDVLAEELAQPNYPDIIGATEAGEILGVARQRVHQLLKEKPGFPQPLYRLKGVGPLWDRTAIEVFKRGWERKPGRPAKKPATP